MGLRFVSFFWLVLMTLIISSCVQKEYYQYLAREKGKISLTYYYRALDFFEQNEMDSAKFYINKAIQIKSSYAPYYYLKGKIYLLQSVKDSALYFFKKALEYKSFYPEVWVDLSELYFENLNYSEALKYYLKLIKSYPQNDQYAFLAAYCYNRLNLPDAALDLLLPLERKNASVKGLYREIILAYKLSHNYDKALFFYKKYVQGKGDQIPCDVIEQVLEIYLKRNEMEVMLSTANRGLQLCPNNPIWHYYRYMYFKRSNQQKLADIEVAKIEQKISFHPSLSYFLGRYFFEKGNLKKAAFYWSKLSNFDKISSGEMEKIIHASIKDEIKIPFIEELYRRTGDKKYKKQLDNLKEK